MNKAGTDNPPKVGDTVWVVPHTTVGVPHPPLRGKVVYVYENDALLEYPNDERTFDFNQIHPTEAGAWMAHADALHAHADELSRQAWLAVLEADAARRRACKLIRGEDAK